MNSHFCLEASQGFSLDLVRTYRLPIRSGGYLTGRLSQDDVGVSCRVILVWLWARVKVDRRYFLLGVYVYVDLSFFVCYLGRTIGQAVDSHNP